MNEAAVRDYNVLLECMKIQGGSYDVKLIEKAFNYCVDHHLGQKRLTNEEYYIHPYNVAKIIITLGMDSQSIAAALLHDVVEDTDVEIDEIKRLFGDDVALLVDGVTKIGRLNISSKEQEQAESLRKMLIAMGKDIRVIIIKLADRLHNMRTLGAMPEQKQRDKALETLEVYAPIAHRLGIRPVKEELEDLAIKHLDPIAYNEIEQLLKVRKNQRVQILEDIEKRIETRLGEELPNVKMSFQGRVKSIHGIYRKMYVQNRDFDEIYDVYAIRVITDTVADCYNILGIILGSVVAGCICFILQFLFFNLDYRRTENVQFEDDEYYYYVKAVPKMTVAAPTKTVKKINTASRPGGNVQAHRTGGSAQTHRTGVQNRSTVERTYTEGHPHASAAQRPVTRRSSVPADSREHLSGARSMTINSHMTENTTNNEEELL